MTAILSLDIVIFSNFIRIDCVVDNCAVGAIFQVGWIFLSSMEKMTEELYEEILSLNPVLFEEVPLTLEDIFSSQFADESDYQLFI